MTIKEFDVQLALGSLSYDDLMELAENPNTSKWVLRKLCRMSYPHPAPYDGDGYWLVRLEIASNPNTPIELLKKLAKDLSSDVVNRAINNPNYIKIG